MSKFGAVIALIVSGLFLVQLFYCLYLAVTGSWDDWFASGVMGAGGAVMGLLGILYVSGYNEMEYLYEQADKRWIRMAQKVDHLVVFIQHTVHFEHVGERFQKLKEEFAKECESQVAFFARREKALSRVLRKGSGDETLAAYETEKATFDEEDKAIRARVDDRKRAFWHYYELIGEVNEILDHPEHVFARPISIKLGGQIPSEEVAEY